MADFGVQNASFQNLPGSLQKRPAGGCVRLPQKLTNQDCYRYSHVDTTFDTT